MPLPDNDSYERDIDDADVADMLAHDSVTPVPVCPVSIRLLNGYWTIFSGLRPIISCASYDRAVELVWT